MEKVMYVIWRDESTPLDEFTRRLRTSVASSLVDAGAQGVQVNVADGHVEAGLDEVPRGLRRVATVPQMDAVVSVWLHSSAPSRREAIDRILQSAGSRYAGYLVTESEPLRNERYPLSTHARTVGFAQVAFLQRPERMSRNDWLDRWRTHHTDVAVGTQSTFEYRQNIVVVAFDISAPKFDGIVEESFPLEALTNRHVFYDAMNDASRFEEHRKRMANSTRTFIDHESGLDVLPTSQYVVAAPPGRANG